VADGGLGYRALLGWEWFKDWLSTTAGLSHHALHVVAGLAILAAGSVIFRRPLSTPWLLLPVAAFEAANEAMDYSRYAADAWPWTWGPSIAEAALTLAPPLLVVLLARWRAARAPA
jgi:hypothetical protein